eukprot:6181386-Pleurochrysis_carterae.AAC.1
MPVRTAPALLMAKRTCVDQASMLETVGKLVGGADLKSVGRDAAAGDMASVGVVVGVSSSDGGGGKVAGLRFVGVLRGIGSWARRSTSETEGGKGGTRREGYKNGVWRQVEGSAIAREERERKSAARGRTQPSEAERQGKMKRGGESKNERV